MFRHDRTYQLEFRRSNSRFYPDVLRACRAILGFTEGEPNVISLTPHTLRAHLRAFAYVYEATRKWKHSRLYIDDVPLDAREKLNFLRVIRCLKLRDESPDPVPYCTRGRGIGETWGCHLLTSVNLLPSIVPDRQWWYQFAVPSQERQWRIDKNRIYEIVSREVRQKQVDICPAFADQFIRQSTDALPDTIDADELRRQQDRSNFFTQYIDPPAGVPDGIILPLKPPPFRKPTED